MTSSLQNSEGKSKFRYIQPTPHPPSQDQVQLLSNRSGGLRGRLLLDQVWRAIGLWSVELLGSTCADEFSLSLGVISDSVFVSEDELLLSDAGFSWILLQESVLCMTWFATTSPDSSWSVTHTYSPGDKTGNSLAPQWVSWFTFCLLFSFLSFSGYIRDVWGLRLSLVLNHGYCSTQFPAHQ